MTKRRERVLIVLAATVLGYVGYFLVAAVQTARDERHLADRAVTASETIATNAHHRISGLQRQIGGLERQVRHSGEKRSRQIGRLEDQVKSLSRQLRQHGVAPVVVVHHHTTVITRTVERRRSRHHVAATVPTPAPTFPGNGRHRGQLKHR